MTRPRTPDAWESAKKGWNIPGVWQFEGSHAEITKQLSAGLSNAGRYNVFVTENLDNEENR